MRTLFHMPLDPACRMVRIVLAEKGLVVRLVETRPWADDGTLAAVNPAGTVPVLKDAPPTGGEFAASPAAAIVEYLDEAYADPPVLPGASAARAETRRICAWFAEKFEREVNDLTLRERVDKRLMRRGQPDYERFKQGADALAWHLDYFSCCSISAHGSPASATPSPTSPRRRIFRPSTISTSFRGRTSPRCGNGMRG